MAHEERYFVPGTRTGTAVITAITRGDDPNRPPTITFDAKEVCTLTPAFRGTPEEFFAKIDGLYGAHDDCDTCPVCDGSAAECPWWRDSLARERLAEALGGTTDGT